MDGGSTITSTPSSASDAQSSALAVHAARFFRKTADIVRISYRLALQGHELRLLWPRD